MPTPIDVPGRVLAASLSELSAARRMVCDVGGVSVLVIKTASGIVAFRNACTHLGLPLDQGRLIGGQIHCPHHGACFDLQTGRAMSGPAVAPLRRFAVSLEGDAVYILPDAAA